jgi:hypothetical protein
MRNRIWLDFSGSNCDLNQVPSLSLCKGWYLNSNEPVQIFPYMTDVSTAIGTARDPDGQVVEQMTNKARHPWRRAADMIEGDWIRVCSQIPQQSGERSSFCSVAGFCCQLEPVAQLDKLNVGNGCTSG